MVVNLWVITEVSVKVMKALSISPSTGITWSWNQSSISIAQPPLAGFFPFNFAQFPSIP